MAALLTARCNAAAGLPRVQPAGKHGAVTYTTTAVATDLNGALGGHITGLADFPDCPVTAPEINEFFTAFVEDGTFEYGAGGEGGSDKGPCRLTIQLGSQHYDCALRREIKAQMLHWKTHQSDLNRAARRLYDIGKRFFAWLDAAVIDVEKKVNISVSHIHVQIYYKGYCPGRHHCDLRLKDHTERVLFPCRRSRKQLLFFLANGVVKKGRFQYDNWETRAVGLASGVVHMDQVGSGASPFLEEKVINMETGERDARAKEVRFLHAAFAAGGKGDRAAKFMDATIALSGHRVKKRKWS